MDSQKQIEEMMKDLKEEKLYALINKTSYMRSAENLYNAGYRKIPEGAVVLTREEYKQTLKDLVESNEKAAKNGYINGCMETAEKFAEMAKQTFLEMKGISFDEWHLYQYKIDKICKEITEGK